MARVVYERVTPNHSSFMLLKAWLVPLCRHTWLQHFPISILPNRKVKSRIFGIDDLRLKHPPHLPQPYNSTHSGSDNFSIFFFSAWGKYQKFIEQPKGRVNEKLGKNNQFWTNIDGILCIRKIWRGGTNSSGKVDPNNWSCVKETFPSELYQNIATKPIIPVLITALFSSCRLVPPSPPQPISTRWRRSKVWPSASDELQNLRSTVLSLIWSP